MAVLQLSCRISPLTY